MKNRPVGVAVASPDQETTPELVPSLPTWLVPGESVSAINGISGGWAWPRWSVVSPTRVLRSKKARLTPTWAVNFATFLSLALFSGLWGRRLAMTVASNLLVVHLPLPMQATQRPGSAIAGYQKLKRQPCKSVSVAGVGFGSYVVYFGLAPPGTTSWASPWARALDIAICLLILYHRNRRLAIHW